MVCVLQSKLPPSSVVFSLYCAPFFLASKTLHVRLPFTVLPPLSLSECACVCASPHVS